MVANIFGILKILGSLRRSGSVCVFGRLSYHFLEGSWISGFQRHLKYPVQMCELSKVPVPGTRGGHDFRDPSLLLSRILSESPSSGDEPKDSGHSKNQNHPTGWFCVFRISLEEYLVSCLPRRFWSGPALSAPVIRKANDGRVEGFRALWRVLIFRTLLCF